MRSDSRRWRRLPYLLAQIDAQFLDAARIRIEHFKLELPGTRDEFAPHRNAPDALDDITAKRVDLFTRLASFKFRSDRRHHLFKVSAPVSEIRAIVLADD